MGTRGWKRGYELSAIADNEVSFKKGNSKGQPIAGVEYVHVDSQDFSSACLRLTLIKGYYGTFHLITPLRGKKLYNEFISFQNMRYKEKYFITKIYIFIPKTYESKFIKIRHKDKVVCC